MCDEQLPPDRYILRRAHNDHFAGDGRAIFRPSGRDTDGLSVYEETADITPEAVKLMAGQPPENYGVVRVSVSDLNDIGLTVVRNDPNGDNPGHCLIKELTHAAYKAAKPEWRVKQLAMLKVSEFLD